MDPELREKLKARRLLLEQLPSHPIDPSAGIANVQETSEKNTHSKSVGELVVCTSHQTPRKKSNEDRCGSIDQNGIAHGKVASLRRAHEVMAARIASPRHTSPSSPSSPKRVHEVMATRIATPRRPSPSSPSLSKSCCKLNEVVAAAKNDEDEGIDADEVEGGTEASPAEPMEYLMLELMPLLPAETAERLLKTVRAGERRTLRLQQSAEDLRTKIGDEQQEPLAEDITKPVSAVASHANNTCPISYRWRCPARCIGSFSATWLCVGFALGIAAAAASWFFSHDSPATSIITGGGKQVSARSPCHFPQNNNLSASLKALWNLEPMLQHARNERHRCELRRQRLLTLRNRSRSNSCAHDRQPHLLADQSESRAVPKGPVETFVVQQRQTIQRLEHEIRTLRHEATACQRCALTLGIGIPC